MVSMVKVKMAPLDAQNAEFRLVLPSPINWERAKGGRGSYLKRPSVPNIIGEEILFLLLT
jgi:hypothetical protein